MSIMMLSFLCEYRKSQASLHQLAYSTVVNHLFFNCLRLSCNHNTYLFPSLLPDPPSCFFWPSFQIYVFPPLIVIYNIYANAYIPKYILLFKNSNYCVLLEQMSNKFYAFCFRAFTYIVTG